MTLLAAVMASADSWSHGDIIDLSSLIVGTLAILVAFFTLHRGNLNASVASTIPLNAEIRDMYEQYIAAFSNIQFTTALELESLETEITTKLERLMNVLELAAAIEVEGTLSGVSRVLMRDYLRRMLDILISDGYTNSKVSNLLQDENTYIFIRRFLKQRDRVSAVLPPKWYAYPKVSWLQRARSFFRY